jgi:hypothetical protein
VAKAFLNAQRRSIFPGINQGIHWSFECPSQYMCEEYYGKIREIRDSIKKQIEVWVKNPDKIEFK